MTPSAIDIYKIMAGSGYHLSRDGKNIGKSWVDLGKILKVLLT